MAHSYQRRRGGSPTAAGLCRGALRPHWRRPYPTGHAGDGERIHRAVTHSWQVKRWRTAAGDHHGRWQHPHRQVLSGSISRGRTHSSRLHGGVRPLVLPIPRTPRTPRDSHNARFVRRAPSSGGTAHSPSAGCAFMERLGGWGTAWVSKKVNFSLTMGRVGIFFLT